MPLTTPYPGRLSVLVMDNARIHHGAEILELAGRFGVHVRVVLVVFVTNSFRRRSHYFLTPVLSGSKPNRRGNIQDKSLDPP